MLLSAPVVVNNKVSPPALISQHKTRQRFPKLTALPMSSFTLAPENYLTVARTSLRNRNPHRVPDLDWVWTFPAEQVPIILVNQGVSPSDWQNIRRYTNLAPSTMPNRVAGKTPTLLS